jgi:hypothetical protein
MDRIGTVAYRLALPPTAQLHPVLHVSQLEKYIGPSPVQLYMLSSFSTHTDLLYEPVAILDRKMVKRGNHIVTMGLVQWSNGTLEDATWENFYDIQQQFPHFNPRGQGLFQGGGQLIQSLL